MTPKKWLSKGIGKAHRNSLSIPTALAIGITVTGCAEMATTLMSAALGYGQPLVATANQNYNQNFSGQLSNLLVALAYDRLKLGPNAAADYGPYSGNSNPGAYPQTDPYGNQVGYNDPYGNQPGYNDPYGNQPGYNDPYQNQPVYNDPNQSQPVYNDPYQNQPVYNDPNQI